MTIKEPERPANSFRVTLNLDYAEDRMDNVLLEALRKQDENQELKEIIGLFALQKKRAEKNTSHS